MANYNNYQSEMGGYDMPLPVSESSVSVRSGFLIKTYLHLAGAVFTFIAIESVIMSLFQQELLDFLKMNQQAFGIFLLALCLGGPFIGNMIVKNSKTIFGHYVALAFYIVMYVLLFIPILTYALLLVPNGQAIVGQAAGVTALLFAMLSAAVFITRKDFSFLRPFIVFATFAAIGLIILSLIFGFALGTVFTYAMIALACCYILYDTSNVLHHCAPENYVLAAVELFASVMLLFFYILRLFLSRNE